MELARRGREGTIKQPGAPPSQVPNDGTTVNDIAECTLPEKILLAASHLEEQGQSPFSAEALIVAAWQKYPRTFGLKGYEEQHPDSNKVLAGIMGEKGLPRRGWLAKVGQKLYALTREGRQVARRLQQGEDVPPPRAPRPFRLSREHDLMLQALLASAAWAKFRQGRQAEWTFSEACRFWDMGDRLGEAVDARLDEIQTTLNAIERGLAGQSLVLGNGRPVSGPEVGRLCDVHEQLEQRFSRHLNLLRSRAERL
jgi:hypothetical protein